MRCKTCILWGLFISIVLLGVIYIAQIVSGRASNSILNLSGVNLIGKLILALATLLLILHSSWTMGLLRGLSLILLSFAAGLAFEIIGVKSGIVFGGYYVYNPAVNPSVFGVPWLVPLIWAGFIYAGYTIVSSYSMWFSRGNTIVMPQGIIYKAAFAAFGALAVMAIDLVMEPLQVSAGNWIWLESGSYFNIPLGNFLGWFMVSFVSIGAFQAIQHYLHPKRDAISPHVLLIPVLGYGLLCLTFSGWALRNGQFLLAVIGLVATAPTVVANLGMFVRWKILRNRQAMRSSVQMDML